MAESRPVSAHGPDHVVVFYEDEDDLATQVLPHMVEGLEQEEALFILQDAGRQDRLMDGLAAAGHDIAALAADGRLVRLDAAEVLDEVFVAGEIKDDAFDRIIVPAFHKASASGARRVRAVGELVDILWSRKEYAAALRVEALWEELLAREGGRLLCSYPASLLDTTDAPIDGVVSAHGGQVMVRARDRLDAAILNALDDLFGAERALEIRRQIPVDMPELASLGLTEQVTFWVRQHLPRQAHTLMDRAKTYYRDGQAHE